MVPPGGNGFVKKSIEELKGSRHAQQLSRKLRGVLERWSGEETSPPLGGDVGSVMTRNVAACFSNDMLHRAAQIMWDRDCGAVPVVDSQGRAVGLVTDRDLCMAVYTRGRALHAISVSSLLSGQLHTCFPHTTLDDAIARMRAHRVRRLVVVEGRGQRLVGMLALADLARHLGALGATRPEASVALAGLLAALSERRPTAPDIPGARGSAERTAERA